MITVSLWAIGDVMIHIVPEHFTLAMTVLYTRVLVKPTAWFCFTLAFAGMVDRPMPFDSPRLRAFLVALIVPFWLAMATNTWHGWFITEVVGGYSVFNPIRYLQAAVNYCLVIASLGIFIYLCVSVRFSGKVFLQTAIMAIGALILDQQGAIIAFSQAAERLQLEEDLQRVRNIESLGLLAGGIVHDFNNVLMSVIGNLTLLTENRDRWIFK